MGWIFKFYNQFLSRAPSWKRSLRKLSIFHSLLPLLLFPALASCELLPKRSELYQLLIAKFESDQVELNHAYPLFDLTTDSSELVGTIEDEIRKLLADGFYLSVGDGKVIGLTYIECSEFLLPLGEQNVTLTNKTNIIRHNEYRIYLTIDNNCVITNVWGVKFMPTRL